MRTRHASRAAGGEVVLPTGKEELGLGNGYHRLRAVRDVGPDAAAQQLPPDARRLRAPVRRATRARKEAFCARRSARPSRRTAASAARGRRRSKCCGRGPTAARPSGTSCRSCRCRSSKLQHVLRRRRRPRLPLNAARGAQAAGPDLPPLGLVRRRLLRVLEMSRDDRRPAFFAAVAAGCARLRRWRSRRRVGAQTPQPAAPPAPTPHRRHRRCSRTRTTAWPATTTCRRRPARTSRSAPSWRSTMMANSARDPYCAGQRAARDDRPSRRTPRTSRTSARPATCRWRSRSRARPGGKGEVFAHLPIAGAGAVGARPAWRSDGISCTVCHQIAADRPRHAARASTATSSWRRRAPTACAAIFGPFAVDAGRQTHHALGDRLRAGARRRTSGSRSCARPATRSSPRPSAPTAA